MAYLLLRLWRRKLVMIEGLFNQTNYVAAKKMLDATVLRHEAIASNIANVETPNYKRIDVAPSFSAQLQHAVASKNGSLLQQLRPELATDPFAVSNRRDGNTVQLEEEMLKLNKNQLEHTFETQMVSGALLKLRLAITGRSG